MLCMWKQGEIRPREMDPSSQAAQLVTVGVVERQGSTNASPSAQRQVYCLWVPGVFFFADVVASNWQKKVRQRCFLFWRPWKTFLLWKPRRPHSVFWHITSRDGCILWIWLQGSCLKLHKSSAMKGATETQVFQTLGLCPHYRNSSLPSAWSHMYVKQLSN